MIKIQSSSYPIIWQIDTSHNLPSVTGQIRWNGGGKYFEVCDNNGYWIKIDNTIQVTCDSEYQNVLDWAKKKIKEEKELEELAKTSPVISDLRNQIREKQEQIKIVQTLIKDEVTVGTR